MSLSDKERERIASCVWGAGSRTRSPLLPSLLGETERIIARHVAAALEQAAREIEAVHFTQWALAGEDAGIQAADIVRAQIHN